MGVVLGWALIGWLLSTFFPQNCFDWAWVTWLIANMMSLLFHPVVAFANRLNARCGLHWIVEDEETVRAFRQTEKATIDVKIKVAEELLEDPAFHDYVEKQAAQAIQFAEQSHGGH